MFDTETLMFMYIALYTLYADKIKPLKESIFFKQHDLHFTYIDFQLFWVSENGCSVV